MNTRAGIFLLLLLCTFAACKSKKAAVNSNKKTSNKQLQALSAKLNLDVDKNDNLPLYQFVAKWLGTPHKLGACNKSGIDCSCFVVLLYEEVYHKKLPRTSAEMYKQADEIKPKNLTEGDLVFFNIKQKKVSHVGVYLKDGWFAHVSTSKGVMINNLSETYYDKYFLGAGKFN